MAARSFGPNSLLTYHIDRCSVPPVTATTQEGNMETTQYSRLILEAHELGAERGRNAASWYFDGNTPAETYARVFQGIVDGDPQVLDTFPSSPLSGEFADEPTPQVVADELDFSLEDDAADDILNAYEDGFHEAAEQEIERIAYDHLNTTPALDPNDPQ